MHYLDKLNPMQKQAVLQTEGPLLIFAGAGSGKTRVLTYRIAHLIELGVDPYNIIAITFTNKAAREMRERVNNITPLGEAVWVSTFHSTCVKLLRREINKMGYDSGFSIYDTQDSERLLKQCIKEANLDDKQYPPRSVSAAISNYKNELIPPSAASRQAAGDFRESNIANLYEAYQGKLRSCNALDFDDIIFRTVELFSTLPDVLEKYQRRFQYVLVDEYQDTNTAQYQLITQLAGGSWNLCVVGDDDQSIYGWRGANIKNILRFEKDFPEAQVVKLEQNYRSTQTILNAANAVISHNFNRSAKKLWTENGGGQKIRLCKCYNDGEEGVFVAETVRRMTRDGNAKLNDFAVLYRNNAQSRAIEDQLVYKGVPYRLFGGVRFYERAEVKDLLAYLKAVHNPADDVAFTRIINVPKRGIGAATITKVQTFAGETGMPFYAALREAEQIPGLKTKVKSLRPFADFMDDCAHYAKTATVVEVVQKVMEETNFLDSLNDGTPEGEGRVENAREVLSKAAQFCEGRQEDKSLGAFLEEVALVADVDNYEEEADSVTLMTLHSAKGLEFNCVFIVGFEENLFPSVRSALSDDPDDLEEERRLCYVGFTRARKDLFISHAVSRMQYGQTAYNAPSRFIKEIPKEYIETITINGKPSAPQRNTGGVNGGTTWGARNGGAAGGTSWGARNGGADYASGAARRTAGNAQPNHGLTGTQSGASASAPARHTPNTQNIPAPKDKPLNFSVGDNVRQEKYGVGKVTAIRAAGADYEVTVMFETAGAKKFMAHLARINKA
jgi:DNA helicase-2/ATP-dependent DNA helicase PcrA